jgi:hypothetical protein
MINSNQNLELFEDYFEQNRIDKSGLLLQLKEYPKRTFNNIRKLIPNIMFYLDELNIYSFYDKFYVVGCPTSTDIDIICIVNKQYLYHSVPLPLKSTEIERLSSELNSIGYDITRGIDINILCIEDKRCIGKSKGGDETVNILLNTHKLHKQYYVYDIEIDFVEVQLIDKLKCITKFIFDYIEFVCIDYKNFRETKKILYREGIESMMNYSHKILELIEFREEKNSFDFFKSIVMKILQLILLRDNVYIYTKDELIEISEKYGLNREHIRYFLTRGKNGVFNMNTFRQLYLIFIDILNTYFQSLHIELIKIDSFRNTTVLSDELFNEFVKSPNSCSDIFEREYERLYKDKSANNLFHIGVTPVEEILLPQDILDKHFIQLPQRSEEWIKMLEIYKCGKNGAEIKDTMEGTYNLLRGAITESIILDKFNPELLNLSGWKKVNVGLLVEDRKIDGSVGCSPDLLLVKDNKIITIEIKTLTDISHNNSYYKKLDLAKKQLQRIEDILGRDMIYKRIIIMAYWKDTLYIECNIM